MTVSKCAAQDTTKVPTDKAVLRYYYTELEKAKFLRKDTAELHGIIKEKEKQLYLKDSLNIIANEKLSIKESEKNICYKEREVLSNDNSNLSAKVKKLKFLSLITAIVGSITTIYFVIH